MAGWTAGVAAGAVGETTVGGGGLGDRAFATSDDVGVEIGTVAVAGDCVAVEFAGIAGSVAEPGLGNEASLGTADSTCCLSG